MKLPISTASSGPSSTSIPSTSSNEDSTRSFRRFLDLITPAEFSHLLRARVRHLLSTWPPGSTSIQISSASNSSSRPGHSIPPTLESIAAFTAFFRSQDSPPPSPSDDSAGTSLSTLHHHLLGLQTLLSFLSGRELKDIVRARLAEGGKEKLVAVRGLMDIMRDSGERGVEGATEGGATQILAVGESDIRRGAEGDSTAVGVPVEPVDPAASASTTTQPRIPIRSLVEGGVSAPNDGQPPKKRLRLDPRETLDGTSKYPPSSSSGSPFLPTVLAQSQPPAVRTISTPSYTSTSHRAQDSSLRSRTDGEILLSGDKPTPRAPVPVLKTEGGLKPSLGGAQDPLKHSEGFGREDAPKVVHPTAVSIEYSDTQVSKGRNDTPRDGNEEKAGGFVVKRLDDAVPSTSRVQDVPPMRTEIGDVVSAPARRTVPQFPPRLGTGHIQRRFSPEKGKQPSVGKEIQEEDKSRPELCSDEEQVLRTALGLPSKSFAGTDFGNESGNCVKDGAAGTDQAVSETNENFDDCSASRSRSRSLSFRTSISGRASPPGPMLRATVNWTSGVSSAADGGSEDRVGFGSREIFDPEQDDGAISPGMFAPKSYTRSQSGGWDDDDDVQTSEAEMNSDGHAMQRRKLFIRLPARPKPRLAGPGVASEGSVVSPSASAHISPSPERSAKRSPKVTAVHDIHTMDVPWKNILQRTTSAPDASKSASASTSSPNVTPSSGATPGIAAPNPRYPVQYPPGSRTQSGSPSTIPHPYALPPRGGYANAQAHGYPGPWFGAMFYVPFRGHPHGQSNVHHPPKMPAGPSRQPSDAAAAGRTGVEEQASGSPASATAPGAPSTQPPAPRKKGIKRADPDAQGQPPAPPAPPPEPDPDTTYTDDIGVKETATVKRRCFNCRGIHAPSWRKSKLTFGKILCNKCGIYESTHMMARPLKTRPRRSQVAGAEGEGSSAPPKKRKSPKKPPVVV